MFCPKCGDPLARRRDELTCVRGNMALSRSMETRLEATFVNRTSAPEEKRFPFRVGGTWFCPGEGEQMTETEGVISCPSCRRSLNPFVHQLVELHPHE
jgi:NADH pyrophosphatase NudC (nudix superfamily)